MKTSCFQDSLVMCRVIPPPIHAFSLKQTPCELSVPPVHICICQTDFLSCFVALYFDPTSIRYLRIRTTSLAVVLYHICFHSSYVLSECLYSAAINVVGSRCDE